MAKIVIIGAGLTGISAAYHLEQKGFHSYKIFEKEKTIGGLCRSVTQDGFTFDFTGHLLHTSDPYFRSLIATLVGFDQLNSIQRRSFIYSHNTYTRYPFQTNLYGLPPKVIAECIQGFVTRKKTSNGMFPEWVQKNFGNGFARHFFMPYQKKIFAYDLHKITSSWTGRFVPKTSLEKIILGSITDNKDTAVGYNAQFYYPKQGGIVSWVNKIAQQLKNTIHTDMAVTAIDMHQKTVHFAGGHIEPFDQLITTMPLDALLNCLQEKSSISLKRAQKKLICNKVVNFNLGVARENLSKKHWLYFPETHYPFYRIGFPNNFASSMAPTGCSSLYGEFAYVDKSQAWVNNMLKKALTETKKLLRIADHEIATQKVMHINNAYVMYDQWRDKNLKHVHARLHEQNIYSIGRYGAWKYSSMQEAVLDGKAIAEQLVFEPARKVAVVKEKKTSPPSSSLCYPQGNRKGEKTT